jgi:hypothetical protein
VEPATPPRIQLPAAAGVTLELRDNLTAAPPRQPTRVTLARQPAHLSVLFECEDTEPWATIKRRDGPLYEEETVEVFLDPFGDLECYFEIEVNPLGALMDLMLRRVGKGWRKELAWNCHGLETAVVRSALGWSASLRIPYAAFMQGTPAPGALWRANFLRIDRPSGGPRELSAWSPTGLNTFHRPGCFGFLEFQAPDAPKADQIDQSEQYWPPPALDGIHPPPAAPA